MTNFIVVFGFLFCVSIADFQFVVTMRFWYSSLCIGRQLYNYRSNGFTVPFTDAAIASIAMKYGIPVWANDKHFEMMKSVIPQLKVYRTEELI